MPSVWNMAGSSPMAFVKTFGRALCLSFRWNVGNQMYTIRKGEDAGFSRRSLRLLCGGWLPHDDGASEGCPTLATDLSFGAVQNKLGDSLYRIGVLAIADRKMYPVRRRGSSRATAVVATTERLPREVSRR